MGVNQLVRLAWPGISLILGVVFLLVFKRFVFLGGLCNMFGVDLKNEKRIFEFVTICWLVLVSGNGSWQSWIDC